ncbi:MAG: hypothetical protein M1818_003741 [Claussenomyces sp. TS43310]|nr:MAG: hypothetical protein M1818_003741 [Claussenomyces sp. TS43310]
MTSTKVTRKVTYVKPGTQPPIYLAGSFSEPAWHPEEMQYTTNGPEHEFYKEVMTDEGAQHQYKFRIGSGEWWVLDEDAPIVIDEVGNRNNLLIAATSKESASSDSSTPSAPKDDVSIPTLVVEKTDAEPSHGDDLGSEATVGQKDAHEMRAQDAEPDVVLVTPDVPALTPNDTTPGAAAESAGTAAEVADAAAILDREDSPPLMTNEEAGRTGHRRMSVTPIQQVALVAAEVADSAAKIDPENIACSSRILKSHETPSSPKLLSHQDDTKSSSDIDAAWEEPAPRLPHEFPEEDGREEDPSGTHTPGAESAPLFPHEQPESPTRLDADQSRRDSAPGLSVFEEGDEDLNDPYLEEFPSDRQSILAHVRSAESRLNADEVLDSNLSSPVTSSRRQSSSAESFILDVQRSPSLHQITEEYQEPPGELLLPGAGTVDDVREAEVLDLRGTSTGDLVVQPLPQGAETDAKLEVVDAQAAAEEEESHPQASAESVTLPEQDEPAPTEAENSVESAINPGMLAHTKQDTPVVRDDDYAALEGATGVQKSTKDDGPGIFVQPADTSDGSSDPRESGAEEAAARTGEVSSAEDGTNGYSEVRNRKVARTERPVTPATVPSPLQKEHAHGFLAALWQTVFVEWIGSLLRRICGSRRQA